MTDTNHELVYVLNQILEIERLRIRLDAAKTKEWCARQVTPQNEIIDVCNEIIDGN